MYNGTVAMTPYLQRVALIVSIACWPAIAQVAARPEAAPTAFFTRYCTGCHNAKLKTAGLVIDTNALTNVPEYAELWEKVDTKLRTGAMPPAGMPRPDQAGYDATATFLETRLDGAARAKPNPGKLPLLHRLSRTEYQNAIRDLLAIDALPQEMDYNVLLPPDNISSGFDNIADLLFLSPATMERYLDAAEKISRFAVGDPNTPLMVNIYPMSPELPQDARVEDLSFGTRGGLAVHSDFPVDGEYAIKIDVGAAREQHQVEITVDGQRMELIAVGGGGGGGRGGRGGPAAKPLEFRVPVKAGPRLIGVTFVEHSEARDETVLRPRMRGRGPLPSITEVTISGPYPDKTTGTRSPGHSPSRERIFTCHAESESAELPCAKKILATLEHRAYRRPVTDADLDDLMPFYKEGRAAGGFDIGIERALGRMLVSPQFLFRVERDPAGLAPGMPHRINDLELASRLSFFLWSSIPDDELLRAAEQGKLHDPAVLEQQTRRMLTDARSESMVTNFAEQWLFLRDIEAKDPDEVLFPDFDETLRADMRRETELFLDSVLRENRGVLDLLTANYTFVNQRLARHYGIPNIAGSWFRRYTFPEASPRGGLLGQGSILTITSYANRTSPVVRGKWVLENLFSAPPPPPPPNIPALKTEGAEPGKTLTMREAMTAHRAAPACAGCHARMDPIGFAMENFDAVGKWRNRDAGNAIDTSGTLPDGAKFDGIVGLKKALIAHPEQFVNTVASKLLMYGLGRNLQYYDAPAVRAIVHDGAPNKYTLASLVVGVVKSPQFQMRTSQ
jgi:mono/diheme cytochrome c family protein